MAAAGMPSASHKKKLPPLPSASIAEKLAEARAAASGVGVNAPAGGPLQSCTPGGPLQSWPPGGGPRRGLGTPPSVGLGTPPS